MLRVLRGAVPLLAAAALGLARPAPAQSSPATPAAPTTAVTTASDDQDLDLPHVVPPHRVVLEPLKEPSRGGQPLSQILPASAKATPTGMDLLAAPALPPSWSDRPAQITGNVVPSGLPGAPAVAALPGPSSPKVAVSHAAGSVKPVATTESRPGVPRSWPRAFVTQEEGQLAETQPAEIHQAAYIVKTPKTATPASQIDAPLYLNSLKQRIAAACGGKAANIAVEAQRNGSIVVKVRLRDAAADQAVAEKIMEVPEMTAPNVHLLMEVER